jgi:hypothetical protein
VKGTAQAHNTGYKNSIVSLFELERWGKKHLSGNGCHTAFRFA